MTDGELVSGSKRIIPKYTNISYSNARKHKNSMSRKACVWSHIIRIKIAV